MPRRHLARRPAAASQEVPPPDPAEVARVLGLPLARLDRMVEVEIRMAWCPVPLWFVPDEPAAEQLLTEGISSGRVWTIAEPLDLPAIPGLTKAHARTLALAKLEVDGLLTDVRPADPRDDVPRAPPTRSSRTRGTRAYVR